MRPCRGNRAIVRPAWGNRAIVRPGVSEARGNRAIVRPEVTPPPPHIAFDFQTAASYGEMVAKRSDTY